MHLTILQSQNPSVNDGPWVSWNSSRGGRPRRPAARHTPPSGPDSQRCRPPNPATLLSAGVLSAAVLGRGPRAGFPLSTSARIAPHDGHQNPFDLR